MNRCLWTIIAVSALANLASAAPVPPGSAEAVATIFALNTLGPDTDIGQPLALSHTDSKLTAAYLFELNGPGFIIVPADDVLFPICAFSSENDWEPDPAPPALALIDEMAEWISLHRDDVASGKTSDIPHPAWSDTNLLRDDKAEITVGPLVTTHWHQSSPYYNDCPLLGGSRCVVGCVATAMAQVMRYHNHPVTGTGSHSYYWADGGQTLSADFNTTYDWANMPTEFVGGETQAQKDAVAKLCYHCGVSVEMSYSPTGSGAVTADTGPALMTYFGYESGITRLYRSSYSNTQWFGLLKDEIDLSQPVIYRIRNADDYGHAIVMDGYKTGGAADMVHLNMGWAGSSDGFYTLTDFPGTWEYNHYAMFGIEPGGGGPTVYPLSDDTPVSFTDIPKGFSFQLLDYDWAGVGIAPSSDHDVRTFESADCTGSAYASSTYIGTTRDFVAVNGHYYGDATHSAEVYYGSASTYIMEAEWDVPDISIGGSSSESLDSDEVLDVFETAPLTAGVQYAVTVDVTSGSPDPAVWIYQAGRSSGSRSARDYYSDSGGAGDDEQVTFTAAVAGNWGIVVTRETSESGGYTISVAEACVAPPAAPTGVNASDGTYTDRVEVTWNASAGATGYKVFRDGLEIGTANVSPYGDTTAVPGVHYDYGVKAYNPCGDSALSLEDEGWRGLSRLVWSFTTAGDVLSSPAVDGGYVYIGSKDDNVYCLDAASGALVWSHATGDSVTSSPAVSGGCVYVGSYDNKVHCLYADTGLEKWSYSTGDDVRSSPAVANGRVYVGSCSGSVYCLDAETGAFEWSYPTADWIYSSPAVVDGHVYVGAYDGDALCCLDAGTGALEWSYTVGNNVSCSPAVSGGHVYFGCWDGSVHCVDAGTGQSVWSYQTGGSVSSGPAVSGGCVYIGSDDNKLHCLNAETGAVVWFYLTGGDVNASPAFSGGYVYVGSYDDKVHCVNAQTGASVWSYTTGSDVWSSPAAAGGRVYVGGYDDKVYCLDAGAGDPGEWPMYRHDPAHTGEHDPVPRNGGWNLIGSGATAPTPLADYCVTNGIDARGYEDAIAAGWVQTMLYYYDERYLECRPDGLGADDSLRPQYGYWFLAYEPDLRMSAYCGTSKDDAPKTPLEFPLDGGWNMIGSGLPCSRPLSWYQLTDGVDTHSYDDAVSAGWVATVVYYYDAAYFECRTDGTGDDAYLRPWYGYWLLTYQPGLTLIVPQP